MVPNFLGQAASVQLPPFPLQRPGKRRRLRLGKGWPRCSATSPDRAIAAAAQEGGREGEVREHEVHIELVSGDRTGRQERHQAKQAARPPEHLSSLYQVLLQWANPLPWAQLPGVAPPSPGSESLHPLPLRGLGVSVGGVGLGLAGMCGAGGRVWGQVPLLAPTGGL